MLHAFQVWLCVLPSPAATASDSSRGPRGRVNKLLPRNNLKTARPRCTGERKPGSFQDCRDRSGIANRNQRLQDGERGWHFAAHSNHWAIGLKRSRVLVGLDVSWSGSCNRSITKSKNTGLLLRVIADNAAMRTIARSLCTASLACLRSRLEKTGVRCRASTRCQPGGAPRGPN